MYSNTNRAGSVAQVVAAGRGEPRGVAERETTAGGRDAPAAVPDPELVKRAKRRTFTATYKARILTEADRATRPGQIGELLRREGLYSSHLVDWRRQREAGVLAALGNSRGRPPRDERDIAIAQLTRRAERAEAELVTMTRVVEIQGNVSALLEEMLGTKGERRSTGR